MTITKRSKSTELKRVLMIASGGGHWVQMRRIRPAFADCQVSYVSVYPDYAADVVGHKYYTVKDMTRFNAINIIVLVPQYIAIMLKERPHVVVTTGSAPGLVGLAMAKLLTRAKTVWIDSIANCERMSSSGKQARYFADEWLTQWPHLATPDGPHYWGAVL
jgi:UDP-N-acetylglucosamine:LPS N-acetylglucosamine transferase